MLKTNREDIVQAALMIERWCADHCSDSTNECDCPFANRVSCILDSNPIPKYWQLAEFLRNRGGKYE